MITIRELPSGFWAVFVDEVFYNAALPSREAAERTAEILRMIESQPRGPKDLRKHKTK